MWHVFADEQKWAQAVCHALAACLQTLLQQQDQVVLAVSGGTSPRPIFACLSQVDLDWSRVVLQLVDERLLSRDHPDSNGYLLEAYLLQHHAQAAQWRNCLPWVSGPARALLPIERQQVLQAALTHCVPADVVVLGMGDDGHTASLFPHAPQLAQGLALDAPQPLLLIEPPTAPHWRISMGLAAMVQAQQLFVAAFGPHKRAVLQQAEVQMANPELPISCVLQAVERGRLHVYA